MLDFFSEEMRRNPYPAYENLRGGPQVLHVAPFNLSMILSYEGVKRALNDHEAFSSSMYTASRSNPEWLNFFDPPRHTKLRALITQAFTPRAVANLETRIRELARELLDEATERGEMDMAADFSIPLPLTVIAEMIGIPTSDRAMFRRWSDSLLKLSYVVFGGEEGASAAAEGRTVKAEMMAYLPALFEQRRAVPKDDLLTRLIHAEVDGERLAEADILGFFQLLLIAGTETTTNLINNSILCFIENPDQLARLRAVPDLMPSAIEEVLRYRSPFQWTLRATRADVEVQGHEIPAGKMVLAMMGSANRDPGQFRDPNRFDITRDPNPHVAFGHGIHFCLGAALSRIEARVALSEFLGRVSEFALAGNEPWEPRKALHVHGPTRLPIRIQLH